MLERKVKPGSPLVRQHETHRPKIRMCVVCIEEISVSHQHAATVRVFTVNPESAPKTTHSFKVIQTCIQIWSARIFAKHAWKTTSVQGFQCTQSQKFKDRCCMGKEKQTLKGSRFNINEDIVRYKLQKRTPLFMYKHRKLLLYVALKKKNIKICNQNMVRWNHCNHWFNLTNTNTPYYSFNLNKCIYWNSSTKVKINLDLIWFNMHNITRPSC